MSLLCKHPKNCIFYLSPGGLPLSEKEVVVMTIENRDDYVEMPSEVTET